MCHQEKTFQPIKSICNLALRVGKIYLSLLASNGYASLDLLVFFRLLIGIDKLLLKAQEAALSQGRSRTKTAEDQYSPVQLEQARLVRSSLYGARTKFVYFEYAGFRNQKYSAYNSFLGNVWYCQTWTKKKPMTTLRLSCHTIIVNLLPLLLFHRGFNPQRFTFVYIKMARKVTVSNLNVCYKFLVCLLYVVFHSP